MTFGIMSWSLVAATVVALAMGGDVRHLASVRIKWWWLLGLALGIKVALLAFHLPPTAWQQPLIFGLVAAGALANRHLPGVGLVAAGLVLNAAVVSANGGVMPFSPGAARAAGKGPATETPQALSRAEDGGSRLVWLDDRIPFPPTRQVISAGDVAIMLGGAWLVLGLLQPTRLRRQQAPK